MAADARNCPRSPEGPAVAVGHGPPGDPTAEVGADQVNPLAVDPERPAVGAEEEGLGRAVGLPFSKGK